MLTITELTEGITHAFQFFRGRLGGSSGPPKLRGREPHVPTFDTRTDTAGLSSAGAHDFTSNKAADAQCPFVTWQKVERGVGLVEGVSMDKILPVDPACDRSLRAGPPMVQRDGARQEESIGTILVSNGGI